MQKKEIMEALAGIIAENLSIHKERVTAGASIVDDLGADSLDVAIILSAVEKKFGIEIPEDEIKEIETVEQLAEYILKKIG